MGAANATGAKCLDRRMENADWIIELQKRSVAEGGPVSDLALSKRMAEKEGLEGKSQ
jgi:hypothetical protein